MALWGFIVPAKVIRESNCVLYCPRMSGPNWARVPHPSTHDGVCLCVCMKLCSTLHILACMMHYVCLCACVGGGCLWILVCIFAPMLSYQEIYKVFWGGTNWGVFMSMYVCACLFVSCPFRASPGRVCVCVGLWAGLDRAWEQVRQHH